MPVAAEAVAPEPEPEPVKIEETTEEAQQYFIEVMSEGEKKEGEDEGEDSATKTAGAKKNPKDIKAGKKDRVLVFDEELGRMVAQKKHKPGRFDEFEDEG